MFRSITNPLVAPPQLAATQPAQGRLARRELWQVGLLLLAGLVLRLVLLWRCDGMALGISDERDYDRLATSIVQRGEFGFEGQLTSIRPPLYPALVAAIYALSGVQNYQAVRLVQSFLALATTAVIYLLARRMFDRRVALVAAQIVCFYPSLIGAGNLVLTETLFTLLVCSFLLAAERYFSTQSRTAVLAAGILLGLAALTRSALWLFPPVAAVFVIVAGPERTISRRMFSAVALCLAFAVTLAPWTIRNTLLQRTFTTVDVMGGRNVMMGNYEYTPWHRPWAAIEIEGDQAWHRVLSRAHGGLAGQTQGQIDKLAMRYALDYMLAHPGQTAARSAAKFFHFWQLERELVAGARRGLWGDFPLPLVLAIAAVILAAYCSVMVLGLFGFAASPPENRTMHWFLLLLLAFVTALHSVAFGHSRYHLPLMPIVIVYAAAALLNRQAILANWRTWPFALAACASLVLAGSWIWDLAFEAGRL